MNKVNVPAVQARFFGLTVSQIDQVNRQLTDLAATLGPHTENGKLVVEAQGIIEDLSSYAELLKEYEPAVEQALREGLSKKKLS